jgi:hypothetical protein
MNQIGKAPLLPGFPAQVRPEIHVEYRQEAVWILKRAPREVVHPAGGTADQ